MADSFVELDRNPLLATDEDTSSFPGQSVHTLKVIGTLVPAQIVAIIAASLIEGDNITIEYDDIDSTITISSTGGGGGLGSITNPQGAPHADYGRPVRPNLHPQHDGRQHGLDNVVGRRSTGLPLECRRDPR